MTFDAGRFGLALLVSALAVVLLVAVTALWSHRAGKFAVVANHEPGEEEKYESEEGDSYHRFLELKRRGSNVAAHDVAAAKVALSRWPVFHRDTVHQMVMCPANGELHLKCAHRGERKYSLHTVG